jgi:putative acetyltransferase
MSEGVHGGEPHAHVLAALARLGRDGLALRAVSDADGPALTALIGAAYDEYVCGPLDPAGFDADLAVPATFAAARGRDWWVVTDHGTLVASAALSALHQDPSGRPVREIHRLYLAPAVRGLGLATALVAGMADAARTSGAAALEAWSDTRLVDAHTRYLALGFRLSGGSRELDDPACTCELHFTLPLGPGRIAGQPDA